MFCWFVAGLALFSLAPHQRADLLWPIMPAAALIAGRELARLTLHWKTPWLYGSLAVFVALEIAGFALYYGQIRARHPLVRQTVALREMAARMEAQAGREFPLTHVDDPTALQVYLDVFRPPVTPKRAADLLRGPDAAFVAVDDLARLEACRNPDDPPLFVVLRDPAQTGLKTQIVGNRPAFTRNEDTAFCYGPFRLRLHGARLQVASEHTVRARTEGEAGFVTITNESSTPCRLRVVIEQGERLREQNRLLGANESWTVASER